MEENFLNNKRLKDNPFKVPKGYFSTMQEDLKIRISNKPTEIKTNSTHSHNFMRPFVTAAASICVAVLGVTAYMHYINSDTQKQDVSDTQKVNHYYVDATDYIIMDNEDIYSYISEQ